MNVDFVRSVCKSLPRVTETVMWGDHLVYKIGGKIFAIAALEPSDVWLSFKCSEEDFAELIERPRVIPAPYLARAHWVALESDDSIPLPELRSRLKTAYELVFAKLPKKVRAGLK